MTNSRVPPTAPIQKNPTKKPREFVEKSQSALVDSMAWECCVNCDHWSEHWKIQVPDETKFSGFREEDKGEHCMKFQMRPPAKVITIGCAEYEPAIPF